MQDKWRVFLNALTGEFRVVRLVSDEAIAAASERTQQIW